MLHKKISFYELEKKLKKIKKISQLKKFYFKFYKNYIKLNKTYLFSSSSNLKYIYNQIDLNKDRIKDKKSLNLIPFGIKDIINTKDLPTDFGIKSRKKFGSGNNARIVDKILGEGGIIFCKTNCAEFAVHYIEKNKQKNPLNQKYSAGTSSTGSAISIACGALPIAIGTQTAGSIIRPSSYCGIYGFKPTYGAIDRTGILKTNDILDTIGILCSDIYGIKKTFSKLINNQPDYPWTKNFYIKKNKKPTIGYFDNNLEIFKNFESFVKEEYLEFLMKLKIKYKLKKVRHTKDLNKLHNHHKILYDKSLNYYVKKIVPKNRKKILSSTLNKIINDGNRISLKRYKSSLNFVNKLKKKLDKNFFGVDYVIFPATASSALKIENYLNEKKDSCLIWTLLGNPSISLPIFKNKNNNMPFGLLIASKRYADLDLIEFSKEILKIK